jgi:hypothetical protein
VFRRIELIEHIPAEEVREGITRTAQLLGRPLPDLTTVGPVDWKHGLTGQTRKPIIYLAWGHMPGPRRRLNRNCRFYFTELGWNKYGRPTVSLCKRHHQRFRIITVKERSVEVLYRDEFQVAVRPRKPRHK